MIYNIGYHCNYFCSLKRSRSKDLSSKLRWFSNDKDCTEWDEDIHCWRRLFRKGLSHIYVFMAFPKRRNCSGDKAVRAILHQTLFSLLIKGILCGFRQIFMHISFPSIEKSHKKVTKQDVTIEQAFQTSPVSLSSSSFHFFLRRIEPPFT